ncbi:MAG TPA: type II toxin-antitoxin system VapC family toxin [Bryobacteraceae bacterium]|jgi:ribonuclease VapC|nr:type II toxin-antitoxin system VapC family toxin [Bryobacteraceae bacterium]
MIVVDTSILIAIIQGEPDASTFIGLLNENDVLLPATVLVEAGIIATNRGLLSDLRKITRFLDPVIMPIDEQIVEAAIGAHQSYGKGRHKASLNFGDCFVYATAKFLGLPLLFKGRDFSDTDVKAVY